MTKRLALFAAVLAAFVFACQGAEAGGRKHVDTRIKVVAVGVGAAATATYFGINHWHWRHWHNTSGLTQAGAWGLTTVGCAAVSPIVATVVLGRPLTQREGHVLFGSCLIPIVGGWLVNEAYNAHPEWETDVAPVAKKHHHKKKMM